MKVKTFHQIVCLLGLLVALPLMAQAQQVLLDKPIKALGMHEVKIRLHPEVTVAVTLNIARSQDEAERQARGENVIASQFEEDRLQAEEAQADLLEGGAGAIQGDYVEA